MFSFLIKIFRTRLLRVVFCITLIVLCVGFLFLFLQPEPEKEFSIRLETPSIQSDTDTDGDGVPDWQEDVTNSDFLNASSFPYQEDIARAKNLTADELLYGGPGEFTEEIVRKILLNTDGPSPVSDLDKETFVDVSVDYFLKRIENKGLPPVHLQIDDTVSRRKVLDDFLLAIKRFSEERKPIEPMVFEVFAKNTSVFPDAKKKQRACDYTLKNIPRSVPADVYDSYFLILERITYLCESLSLALIDNSAENYFYVLKLLSSGRLFADLDEVSEQVIQQKFLHNAIRIQSLLERSVEP